MLLPLFNFFEFPLHPQLYGALRSAGPRRAWELMVELADLDRPNYERGLDDGTEEALASLRGRTRGFMDSAPALDGADKDVLVAEFCQYGPRMQFDATYITLWLSDPRVLFGEVMEVRGLEHLRRAREDGRGVLALPLHLGPSYVVSPVMAHHIPTTIVYNRMNFDEIKQAAFPDLPVDAFQLSSTSTFRAGVAALRAGRAFSIFPELDPRGVDDHHQRVPLLGTTVMAPIGPVLMSRMAQAPMMPVVAESLSDGHFRLTFHELIQPPARGAAVDEALLQLWSVIDSELITGAVDQWEMWYEFDQMQPLAGLAPAMSPA